MSYRPPQRPPRGAWARHLHRARRERGWSQQRAFEAFREGLGFGEKSRASYAAIDMGDRQPTEREAAYLISQIGPPPDEDAAPLEEPGLAEAIRELAAELRAARQERAEWQERVLAVEAAVALLTQRSGARRSGSAAPQGIAE